jgi:hypothetical protein
VGEPWGFVNMSADGLVHVYDVDGSLLTSLESPQPTPYGAFGGYIASSDEFILVRDNGWGPFFLIEGRVHVFDYDWNLVTTLRSPDGQEYSAYGVEVAISGDLVVVGEHWATVDGLEKAGRAHIYDTDWNHIATLNAVEPQENAQFGEGVAIGGGIIVVGERRGDAEVINDGRAYVFDLEGNHIATLTSPEPEIGAQFGSRVDTDGEIVVLGELGASVDGFSKRGKVHVYQAGTVDFTSSGLTINPGSVSVGGECSNEGSMSGSHTVVLMINGDVEDEETVTLAPDESTTVSFDAPTSEKGTYSVEIEGLTGSYEVKGGIPGFPLESIVMGILVLMALWLTQRQR